jgi:hypothetical protein
LYQSLPLPLRDKKPVACVLLSLRTRTVVFKAPCSGAKIQNGENKMTKTQKTKLLLVVVCLLQLDSSISAQSGNGKQNGGGGGGNGSGGGGALTGPIPQIAGEYSGEVVAGKPVIPILSTVSLTEDQAGNLSGTICMQECMPLISGTATASPFFPFGVFQFKAGDDQISGIVQGPVSCSDGATGMWIAGGFQNRGETSTFSFTTCR